MAWPVLWREQRRRAPWSRAGLRRAARGLRLAGAGPGGGGVGPRVEVRAYRAYGGRSGQREGGVDLGCVQGQRPFLGVGDALGVTVGERQQALGLGIVFRARHRSSRWSLSCTGGNSRSRAGRCIAAPCDLPLAVEDRKEVGAVITVNLTMDEAQAVAGAIRELVERSELNELVLGPIDWDDLRTANDKLTKAIGNQV